MVNPVPSAELADFQRNVQDTDRFVNTDTEFTNRTGQTIRPLPLIAQQAEEAFALIGWTPAGFDFTAGGTLTTVNQVVSDGSGYWRWDGALPKTVTAGSSPTPTGVGAWILVSFGTTSHNGLSDRQAVGAHDDIYSRNFKSVTDLRAQTDASGNVISLAVLAGNKVHWRGYYTESDGGSNWGIVKVGNSTAITDDGGSIFVIVNDSVNGVWVEANLKCALINVEKFGAKGDGIADDTVPVENWLEYLTTNSSAVGVGSGIYAIDTISIGAPNGLTINANATFKAVGSNRLNMIQFLDVTGSVNIDGITVDGSDIVARPFEIKNIGNITAGNVYIGERCKFINAKNVSPLTHNSSGCRIQGKFENVVFEGEVDGVDNSLTSGAVSVGAWFDWSGTDFINNVIVTNKARIKNVKNDNTVTADADGIQRMGPTDQLLYFTVEPGAYFENCKGRSIKSQVKGNAIDGPIIVRDAYDGLVEIDCQYAGGYVKGSRITHDGKRVDTVIGSSTRLGLASDMTMAHNTLRIVNPPASPTEVMCFFWGTDNTDAITQDGLLCYDNKVIGGSVNHMVIAYAANVVNTNRITVRDNYAEAIAASFFNMRVVFNNPAQLTIVFEGNACKTQCTGATIVSGGQLRVESDRCNSKISPLIPYQETISGGVLTLYAGNFIQVATEGGAGFDDIDTITGGNYSAGDTVTFKMWTPTQRPTFKNGTGNIFLAGSDFELNSVRDTLVLSYDATNDEWHEVSRADNG